MLVSLILVFQICTASGCQKVTLPFDGSLQQCMMYGQFEVNRFLRQHPDYGWNGRYECRSGDEKDV